MIQRPVLFSIFDIKIIYSAKKDFFFQFLHCYKQYNVILCIIIKYYIGNDWTDATSLQYYYTLINTTAVAYT